jgi:hypothetical protein
MGGGILPVAKYNNKVYFLVGMEERDKMWSDFGGGKEKNETPFQTATREGYEELDGFLGDYATLQRLVKNHLIVTLNIKTYSSFLFEIPYAGNLPSFYNNHHAFIKKKMPNIINKDGYYEKSQIQWMTFSELKLNKSKFRLFYRDFIDIILQNEKNIYDSMLY